MNIGIFGATGLVGQEFLKLLENKNKVTYNSIRLFASESSIGKHIVFNNFRLLIEKYDESVFKELNVVILCTGTEVSKHIVPMALRNNCFIIDNSSAFRMNLNVPLVIPEINRDLISSSQLIANPNCCTALLCMVLHPLNELNKIKRVIVSTYQSASGAGQKGLDELSNPSTEFPVFGRQYMYNVFSHNSEVNKETGYNDEETKIMEETKKILNSDLNISATCVRVPVLRAHSESVNIEFENPICLEDVRFTLKKTEGVKLEDDQYLNQFPEPIKVENKDDVMVGRVRYDLSDKTNKTINLFLCGDQLLKGAALNAYQILTDYANNGISDRIKNLIPIKNIL